MFRKVLILAALVAQPLLWAEDVKANKLATFMHPRLKLTVVAGRGMLPGPDWEPLSDKGKGYKDVQFYSELPEEKRGRRRRQYELEQNIGQAEWSVRRLTLYVRDYAKRNDKVGPATYQDLASEQYFDAKQLLWNAWSHHAPDPTAGDPNVGKLFAKEKRAAVLRSGEINLIQKERREINSRIHTLRSRQELLTSIRTEAQKELNTARRLGKDTTEIEKKIAKTKAGQEEALAKAAELQAVADGITKKWTKVRARHIGEVLRSQREIDAARKEAMKTLPGGAIDVTGPYMVMIPKADCSKAGTPVVFELRPYIDDGKHYVGYADGRVRRVTIDKELMRRHKLAIRPLTVQKATAEETGPCPYVIYALLVPGTKGTLRVPLTEDGKTAAKTLVLDLSKAEDGDMDIFSEWAAARASYWYWQAQGAPTSALATWAKIATKVYGPNLDVDFDWDDDDREGRQTSVFGILGGRAAIRETLQMQVINAGAGGKGERTVPISQIKGVEVKSHPFKQMLGRKPGGRLPIAECVPIDRFFIYFAKPEHLATYLDDGSSFMFQSSSVATTSSLSYDLKEKYAKRLGLGTGWSRIVLRTKAVKEVAVVLPDLFFIDGTDITLAMRVTNLQLLQPALKVIGVSGLENGAVVQKKLPDGGASYWVSQGDMLIVSTHRMELARCLMLLKNNGKGSLGQSDEFRYMLTKLPVTANTWGYAYLSDPFIRRLVGPEMKIGQLRRINARARLEAISSAALLHRNDLHAKPATIDGLKQLGYLPNDLSTENISLDKDLVATSKTYGRSGQLATLLQNPVDKITLQEQKAYQLYLRNYTEFWRQFFDPIAVRLDSPTPGTFDLEVFILPLLNSEVYDVVKQFVTPHGKGPKLRMPEMKPQPVLTLSANISDKAWVQMVDELGEMAEAISLDTRILDELGPSVHFSIMDADPVINLGSGDILGALGSGGGRMWGMGAQEMMMVPFILSALTRPCKIAVELRNSQRAIKYLRAAGKGTYDLDDDFSISFARLPKRDAWVCTFDIMNILKLRFGVEVKDGFLIVSNIPWAWTEKIKLTPGVLDTAALQVVPRAGKRQLAGLYTAAVESERKATFASAAHLLPFMLTGAKDPSEAAALHRRLFGFTPALGNATDTFSWNDGMLTSKRYGTLADPLHPEFVKGNRDFGMLRVIDKMTLSAQLEEDGLRTRCRWTMIQPNKP